MIAQSVARLLPRLFLPPIWREVSTFERSLSQYGDVLAPTLAGRGQPVLLIPGFLAGDSSLRPLAHFLDAAGHSPHPAGICRNVDCSESSVARITAIAERLAERHGRPVAVVGHSRGGLFARVLGRRRPDLVSSVITLASPHRDQLAIHPLLWATAATLATFGTLRARGFLRWSCQGSGCCARFVRDLGAPLPTSIGLLSVYSRQDGVVDWRVPASTPAGADSVASTHCGMITHNPTLWAVAAAIAEFAATA